MRHDGHAWHVSPITRRTTPFELKGTSTRRPPLSRSLIFIERPKPISTSAATPAHAYVIYRDDERGGRVTLAATADADASQPAWTFTALTADAVGAWEPSADPVQWPRFRQIHLLVQAVEQRDGNDRHPASLPPGPIGSLIWPAP